MQTNIKLYLGNECGRQVFPISGSNSQAQSTIHPAIDANYYKGPSNQRRMINQLNQPTHSNDRVYADDGISPTLNTAQGGNRQPFIAAQRGRANGQTLEPQTEDKSNTLTAVAKDNYVVDMPRIRRLTPTECERLMSWPDGWTIGSDTQRYKQCGNGVVSNVVQAVVEKLNKTCAL